MTKGKMWFNLYKKKYKVCTSVECTKPSVKDSEISEKNNFLIIIFFIY